MNNFIQNKIMPPMMKFLNTRAVTAIKNGMIYPIPFIIIGSVFLILGQLPFQAGQDFMNKIKLGPLFLQINNASFGIMALLAVFGIAYAWVRDAGYEGVPAGLTGIIVHILLQPDTIHQVTSVTDPTKVSTAYQVGGVIDRAWLGGKGMVLSIIVGLLVGWIYTGFMRRNITIKMPEQVPENVAASFTSLVPAGAIIALAGVVHGITTIGFNTTFIELVYKWIQTPLQHVTVVLSASSLLPLCQYLSGGSVFTERQSSVGLWDHCFKPTLLTMLPSIKQDISVFQMEPTSLHNHSWTNT